LLLKVCPPWLCCSFADESALSGVNLFDQLADEGPLCANDSETVTSPGITVEGGERCLSHGEPEEGEFAPAGTVDAT